MKLFYYATEMAVQALWDYELKISSPCDFNDPFEFLPSVSPVTRAGRELCVGFREATNHNFYILSLSARRNNARMWAQYGGNHTGLMLTLNFARGVLKKINQLGYLHKVTYSKKQRHIVENFDNLTMQDVIEVSSHKGSDWRHEQEWRIIIPDNQLPKIGGRIGLIANRAAAFFPLRYECISSVTLGHRTSLRVAQTVRKIKRDRQASWSLLKAKLSDFEFSFVDEQIAP